MIKNQNTSANARTVFCIGDPYIKPPLPTSDIKINSINGLSFEDWDASGFTLKALDRVVLEGNIIDKNTREVQDGFDGEATLVLFDKNIESTTLGNDGATDVNGLVIQRFNELGNTIFRGKATVESGAFQIEFLLPKNIDFDIGQGKVSVYAVNNEKTMDVSGASNLLVGGLNYNAQRDDTPPSVELYLNDAHFYSGQLVGNSPLVHVKVTDDNGINTSGGVGHDIVVILDEDTANPIVLNQYYTADIDDFTKGALSYQLVNLNPGEHTLELRISDTYNNVASQEINFRVGSEEDFLITNVLSYPNPCVSYTEFSFTHTSVPNDVLEVTLQLMTLSGQVIAQQFVTFSGANSYTGSLNLDVQDNLGNKLAQGVYLYNITVKSTILNQISSKIQRLVVL